MDFDVGDIVLFGKKRGTIVQIDGDDIGYPYCVMYDEPDDDGDNYNWVAEDPALSLVEKTTLSPAYSIGERVISPKGEEEIITQIILDKGFIRYYLAYEEDGEGYWVDEDELCTANDFDRIGFDENVIYSFDDFIREKG